MSKTPNKERKKMAKTVEKDINISSYKKVKVRGNLLYLFVKRTFDICFSLFALVLLSLPLSIILLLKSIEDYRTPYWKLVINEVTDKTKKKYIYVNKDGKRYDLRLVPDKKKNKERGHRWINPIYKSERIGKDGRVFRFYKIRSMVHHAENMKNTLIDYGFNEADEPMFKMANDPRITKLGRFIRKTSIDELPQLINVLKGDLSIVGPRSPITFEYEQFSDYEKQKCLVKGGLLCLWQIQPNRHSIKFDDWIELDLKYIEQRSLWLDIKIIFKGVWMVVFDRSGE